MGVAAQSEEKRSLVAGREVLVFRPRSGPARSAVFGAERHGDGQADGAERHRPKGGGPSPRRERGRGGRMGGAVGGGSR